MWEEWARAVPVPGQVEQTASTIDAPELAMHARAGDACPSWRCMPELAMHARSMAVPEHSLEPNGRGGEWRGADEWTTAALAPSSRSRHCADPN